MGCCLNRNQKEGKEEFSKSIENIQKVKEILSNSNSAYANLKILHEEHGWRMFHSYKLNDSQTYWLTDIVKNSMFSLLCSDILSLSEESLMDNKNYISLLSDSQIRKNVITQYKNSSLIILETEIRDFILKKLTESKDEEKADWQKIKEIFQITDKLENEKQLDNISLKSLELKKDAEQMNELSYKDTKAETSKNE